MISNSIPSMEQLGLPPACMSLLQKLRGLFLVTGLAGSGKSTSIGSMLNFLKDIGRVDHDVMLVGEIRDRETFVTAIHAAETGRLVFGTLHTTGAQGTLNHIIEVFPASQQDQIRTRLSNSLVAVLSQALVPKIGGGRIAAFELLVCTTAIGNLVRENKTSRITSAIHTGPKLGMMLLDDSLFNLWKDLKCTKDDVMAKAASPDELAARIAKAENS
jgi:twitching motility protein PilT